MLTARDRNINLPMQFEVCFHIYISNKKTVVGLCLNNIFHLNETTDRLEF